MKRIESRQNPEIKKVYALRKAEERKKQQSFIAEGERACATLITGGSEFHTLYATEEHAEHILKLVPEEQICIVTQPVMEKISHATTPSGILGVFKMPPAPSVHRLSNGIVLTNISDPGNMGTLIRTAVAMNVKSIVIIGGADPWSFKVIQATAGYINHIPLFQINWKELTTIVQKNSLTLCALIPSGGKKPDLVTKENLLLVVGSEAHGISTEWLSDCKERISLAMPGKIESLNVAVAGSIALYIIYAER